MMGSEIVVVASTLEVDFDRNLTDLYRAITEQNWERATQVCKEQPEQAATWVVRHYEDEGNGEDLEIMWRFLPLHSACARQPPATLIEALLNAYPDGAKCVDDQGMYALHYACGNQASEGVVRHLLSGFPEAPQIPDPRGMLPIHYLACWGPSSMAVIDLLMANDRAMIALKDSDGNTPLDLALEGEYREKSRVVSALRKWSVNIHREPSGIDQTSNRNKSRGVEEEKREDTDTPLARSVVAGLSTAAALGVAGKSAGAQSSSTLKLQDEIKYLKSRMFEKELEWEMKLAEAQKEMQTELEAAKSASKQKLAEQAALIEQQKEELVACRKIASDLQSKAQESSATMESKEREIIEVSEKAAASEEELKGLQASLGDLMEKHDTYKKKTGNLTDRIGSLSVSLESMMEQQSILRQQLHARHEERKGTFEERQSRLMEIIDMEKKLQEEDSTLATSLEKQTREMEAIAAVIAATRE